MRIFKQLFLGILVIIFSTASQAEIEKPEIEPFSQAEIEQVLAPIALYPDTVLSHILIASTYPIEVVQAERWTSDNPEYKGSRAVEAVEEESWDPSVKALVAFPGILKRLSENLEWTQKLGDAFLQNEQNVLAGVQQLRQRANESGYLDKMDKVAVTEEDDAIVIEPIEREVVYVPYYDTRVVYGSWHWAHYPPVYWHTPYYANYGYNHHSPFYWGARVHLPFGFFFSTFHWHNHHVIRLHSRPNHRHHYYNRHQIAKHNSVKRWSHNPTHRRGVSYRSVSVSNRYKSNRPSRSVIKSYRKQENNSHRRFNKKGTGQINIASPKRIRQELKDGRITVKERKSRPKHREMKRSLPKNNRVKFERNNRLEHKKNKAIKNNRVKNERKVQKIEKKRHQRPAKVEREQRSERKINPSHRSEHRSSRSNNHRSEVRHKRN